MKKLLSAFLVIALLAAAGYSYYSPQLHVKKLKAAAQARDTRRISELVDFPAVRAGLKDDFKTLLVPAQRENAGEPLGALGLFIVGAMIEPIIDAMVSPAAIIAMLEQGKVRVLPGDRAQPPGDQVQPPGAPSPPRAYDPKREVIVEQGYESYDRYRIRLRPAEQAPDKAVSFVLTREGLFHWKVSRIVLPPSVFDGKPLQ
jgi:hypothetical protein